MPSNLFEPAAVSSILQRLRALDPKCARQWGKMSVAQMLAHLSVGMELAVGDLPSKQMFFGKILAPFVKKGMLGDKPFPKNSPTGPRFIIKDERNFDIELKRIITFVERFAQGGPEKCTKFAHEFFGKLTPDEWARLQWKHIDHHLRQFGG